MRLDFELVELQNELDQTISARGVTADTPEWLTAEEFRRETQQLRRFLADADTRVRAIESNVRRRGYGFGESLLVRQTRDPAHYQNGRTYVQLYRSDNDISMERVLDAHIEQHIGDGVEVEILYEPGSGYVTIAIDRTDTVRYRTWFAIDSGLEVALRSLGDGARFEGLEILTTGDALR